MTGHFANGQHVYIHSQVESDPKVNTKQQMQCEGRDVKHFQQLHQHLQVQEQGLVLAVTPFTQGSNCYYNVAKVLSTELEAANIT